MSSKRTYIATFWRSNPQLKNGGYYTTKEFQSVSHKAAERQAERYTKGMIYGSLNLISVELKQENSKGQSICRELLHKLWRTVWTSETIYLTA